MDIHMTKRQELLVAALENGTVIDHIPSAKLFEVINLLQVEEMKASVTIGFNLKSRRWDRKVSSRLQINSFLMKN